MVRQHHSNLYLHVKDLLSLSFSIIGAQLLQSGFLFIDLIFVGRVGIKELAAFGFASSLYTTLMTIFSSLFLPIGPYISQSLHDDSKIKDLFLIGFILAFTVALISFFSLKGLSYFIFNVDQLMGIREEVHNYLSLLCWNAFPTLLFLCLRQYHLGLGEAPLLTKITFYGFIFNIIGDELAFQCAPLDLRVSCIIGVTISVFLFLSVVSFYNLLKTNIFQQRFKWELSGELISILFKKKIITKNAYGKEGSPQSSLKWNVFIRGFFVSCTLAVENLVFLLYGILMGTMGSSHLAAFHIVFQCIFISFAMPFGISVAASLKVSSTLTSSNSAAARRVIGASLLTGGLLSLVVSFLFFLFPESLTQIFVKDSQKLDENLLGLSTCMFYWAALFQIGNCFHIILIGILRGFQNTFTSFKVIFYVYIFLGIPLGLLLTPYVGLHGPWVGLNIAIFAIVLLLGLEVRRHMGPKNLFAST